MNDKSIPTYAEIASFKESLLKSKKNLDEQTLKSKQEQLVRMEFRCLRSIDTLIKHPDDVLLARARIRARLEHYQYQPEKGHQGEGISTNEVYSRVTKSSYVSADG